MAWDDPGPSPGVEVVLKGCPGHACPAMWSTLALGLPLRKFTALRSQALLGVGNPKESRYQNLLYEDLLFSQHADTENWAEGAGEDEFSFLVRTSIFWTGAGRGRGVRAQRNTVIPGEHS